MSLMSMNPNFVKPTTRPSAFIAKKVFVDSMFRLIENILHGHLYIFGQLFQADLRRGHFS